MRHTRELGLYADKNFDVTVLRLFDKNGEIKEVPGLGIHSLILQLLRALLMNNAVLLLGSVAVGLLEDEHHEKLKDKHMEICPTILEVYEGFILNYQVQPYTPLAIRGDGDWLDTDSLRQMIVEHSICIIDQYFGPWPIDELFEHLKTPDEAELLGVLTQHCRGLWYPDNDGWTLVHAFRNNDPK